MDGSYREWLGRNYGRALEECGHRQNGRLRWLIPPIPFTHALPFLPPIEDSCPI